MSELLQVSENVRIERGPARKKGKATPELLDDAVTATHYHLPRQVPMRRRDGSLVVDKDGKPRKQVKYARDAAGVRITEPGQEIEYLDIRGKHVWYVYAWRYLRTRFLLEIEQDDGTVKYREVEEADASLDENGEPLSEEVWCYQVDQTFDTRDEALAHAKTLED